MNHLQKLLSACISITLVVLPTMASAISNSGKIPILLYHANGGQAGDCNNYATNSLSALAQDLNAINDNGFIVVPLYWVAEWVAGTRDGSTLPAKPIAITFDDGNDVDFLGAPSGCSQGESMYSLLQAFKNQHQLTLPWYSPHAVSFVIASPTARSLISGAGGDSWWSSAQASGLIEVYNHSWDHDHAEINPAEPDPDLSSFLGKSTDIPVAGVPVAPAAYDFYRIDNYVKAKAEIEAAADFIYNKIGVWPDLFAYPGGRANPYLINTYFPTYGAEHGTFAAFCLTDTYATRSSNRYCIPRFTHMSGWTSANSFVTNILNNAP